ncbi:complex I NDUFA9 subunit family protein [Acetobacter thailandicus]|uniref:Complex I NDUFA9 subunit family protein n=1 Tax=Acetobacter thailandicus TaxID=1502842 RepID=A0ABT3QBX4_9PROT|nr:complex I NDUFA9 subunit family protein [Acetobacter thailandicus]MCX2562774.1 complex I NDUFA9 subunit family protein [Acetobacter thailandicus]NHN94839.1 NAD(P)H-binding protein [Acetobacter thailandicus]
MSAGRIATVFGGNGFVGQYVVQHLARAGYLVRVAGRRPDLASLLRPLGDVGQIAPFYAPVQDEEAVACVVKGASVVVNLVAVLGGRGLESVNVEGAKRVARLSAAAGVETFVQVSALGAASDAPSAYGRSRAAGEEAVKQYIPTASIIRPSVIFGPDDHFFNRLASLARFLPVMPVYGASARLQPVFVGDVAESIARIILTPELAEAGKTWSLGGPDILTMREIYRWILAQTKRENLLVRVPGWIATLQAAFFERLPGQILTRDQLRMLSQDNVLPPGEPGFAELDMEPNSIERCVPFYMERFRPGGGRSGIIVSKQDIITQ